MKITIKLQPTFSIKWPNIRIVINNNILHDGPCTVKNNDLFVFDLVASDLRATVRFGFVPANDDGVIGDLLNGNTTDWASSLRGAEAVSSISRQAFAEFVDSTNTEEVN